MASQYTQKPNRILAVKLRELGDTAIWTSALKGLHQLFPHSELHVLVNHASKPLLINNRIINSVHSVSGSSSLRLILKLLQLRHYRFDLALGFHSTTSLCRWIPLLGANRVALHHHSWSHNPKNSNLTLKSPGALEDAIKRDYQILESLGWQGPRLLTRLEVLKSEQIEAKNLLTKSGIDFASSRRRLVLLPGARTETRRYPKELWVETIRLLKSKSNYQIYVVADPELSSKWNLPRVCEDFCLPLFDNVNLRQFMALVSLASKALANDSGPFHISVALGVSTVALFGPGCLGDWYPYGGVRHVALRIPVECRTQGPRNQERFQYCSVTQCDHLSCLRQISPSTVFQCLTQLSQD